VSEATGSNLVEVSSLCACSANGVLMETSLLQARLAGALDTESSGGIESLVLLALVLEVGILGPLSTWDLILALDELDGKTTVRVPSDMAMHQPSTWVVGLEADDSVTRVTWKATSQKHGSITTRWVDKVEKTGVTGGEDAGTLAEKREIVAVQMDGMADWQGVLDDKVDPLDRCLGQDHGVADELGLVLGDRLERWLGPVDIDETIAVEEPTEDKAIVRSQNCSDIASWESLN